MVLFRLRLDEDNDAFIFPCSIVVVSQTFVGSKEYIAMKINEVELKIKYQCLFTTLIPKKLGCYVQHR